MIIFLFWYNIVLINNVRAVLLPQDYSVNLTDNFEYKMDDISLDVDDLEMISDEQVKMFQIQDKEKKLHQLEELAEEDYYWNKNKKASVKTMWFQVTNNLSNAQLSTPSEHKQIKREETSTNDLTTISQTTETPEFEYDYNELLNEYYDESVEEVHNNKTFNANETNKGPESPKQIVKAIVNPSLTVKNCTEEELKHIGLKAIKCLQRDFIEGEVPKVVLLKRLGVICKVWFMVYLAIATPLWCTRGWCCCCLFCKFFNPRERIYEAKQYVLNNPPGVLIKKSGSKKKYKPSEYEWNSYREVEYYITTL